MVFLISLLLVILSTYNQDFASFNLNLDSLSITDLKKIAINLRGGATHLGKILTSQEFKHLIHLGALNPTQKERIHVDFLEKLGPILLIINTILTGFFGAWMGFHSFIDASPHSFSQLCFLAFIAILLCIFFSFYSFRTNQKKAEAAVIDQKIANIQLDIAKLLLEKYEQKIVISPTDWISEKKNQINTNEKISNLLKKLLLIQAPDLPQITLINWLNKNYLTLLIGFFPTLFGCFGSMFVYLAGGPDLAKSLGFHALFHTLKHPYSQFIEFIAAICLTGYFGFTFAYNNFKLYNRETQIALTHKQIVQQEKKIAEIECSLKYEHS